MAGPSTRGPTQIERFLALLASQVGDRGVMADLRHGLSKTTEYRAWPHIAPWCRLENDKERCVWLTVSAGYALCLSTSDTGNMGTVMRAIATTGGRGEKGLSTFDARFRRFLSCSSSIQVCDHLVGVLRAASRQGVPVNFAQLFADLMYWGDKVKVHWASEYWAAQPPNVSDEQGSEEDDDGEAGEEEAK